MTLGGVSLVQHADCQPHVHDGIVFSVAPIHLPEGFYAFEYTLRTDSPTTYMMASVLPGSVPRQPEGLISASHGVLYLPAVVGPLIGDVQQYDGSAAVDERVSVVQLTQAEHSAAHGAALGAAHR